MKDNFYLSKYPVTSESGREYRVDIYPDIFDDYVVCIVYEPVEKRTIFGGKKVRFRAINYSGFLRALYDEKRWGYDYIAIAHNEIKEYEQTTRDELEHVANRKEAVNKFENWDGRLSE